MKSQTSLIAKQIRMQQWAEDVAECNSRPAGMTIDEWCSEHGMKKATYYWRLGALRKACLDTINKSPQKDSNLLVQEEPVFKELKPISNCDNDVCSSATLRIGAATLEINDSISDEFLIRLMRAASHA